MKFLQWCCWRFVCHVIVLFWLVCCYQCSWASSLELQFRTAEDEGTMIVQNTGIHIATEAV